MRAPTGPWRPAYGRALARQPLVALNFHVVSPENRAAAARQVRAAAALGVPFDLDAEPPPPGVPRVLVAFYDGFAETGHFGAELCHGLGLRAFFFPVSVPLRDVAVLTDDDLAAIAGVHEVGFHTATHAAADEVTEATVEAEVVGPYERIRAITGRAPRVGAWRGGTRFDEAQPGNRALRGLGLTHLVSNWSVEPLPPADVAAEPVPDGLHALR